MTPDALCLQLDALGVRVIDTPTGPTLRFPDPTTGELVERLLPLAREHRAAVMAFFEAKKAPYEGHVCEQCKADVFVRTAAEVAQVCQHLWCPFFDRHLWPAWAEDWRGFQRWKAEQDAKEKRRQAEPIPD